MSKFIAYLKWVVKGWSVEQRLWILGGAFAGWGFPEFMKTGQTNLAMHIAFGMWMTIFFKWFIWDMVKSSWHRFEEDRAKLFETIDKGK